MNYQQLKITQQFGFTLLELMIVLVIAGILMAVAFPSFSTLTRNNCLTIKANSFVNSLQYARSEAIKRNAPITLNASNGSVSTNEWGTGWAIVDGAGSNLKLIQLDCATTTVNETGDDTRFTYQGDGFIDSAGTFEICDDRDNERGKQITISATGRPSTDRIDCT